LRRISSGLVVALLFLSFFAFIFTVQPTKAQSGTIYIMPDGSISPSTTSISTVDNITYTLTGNIVNDGIVIERNNTVVNGAGYTLQGPGNGIGIELDGRNNVSVKNMKIKAFSYYGVYLDFSSNCTVSENDITNNGDIQVALDNCNDIVVENLNMSGSTNGVALFQTIDTTIIHNKVMANQDHGVYLGSSSSNDTVYGNNITNNWDGVSFGWDLGYNTASGNIITNNGYGVAFYDSSGHNIVSGNIITDNVDGAHLYYSSNNRFFHNNFDNNTQYQAYSSASTNIWDAGYPSGGNYWSDYLTRYPAATEIDNSGIWNTPYVIDSNNIDHSPLMKPYSPLAFSVSILPSSATLDVGQYRLFNSSIFLGISPYTYHWYLNGVLVLGASRSLLNFSEPVGSYTVYLNVTDSTGATAKSNVAQVTVYPSQSVTISPPSASIYLGQSVYFTSTVTGGVSPYAYQWYLNQNVVQGANSTDWMFTPTQKGTYYVWICITDSSGAICTSTYAQVTVTQKPITPSVGGVSASVNAFGFLQSWLSIISLLAIAVLLKGFIAKKKKLEHKKLHALNSCKSRIP
jgi:parallel beta-helix repeat protein